MQNQKNRKNQKVVFSIEYTNTSQVGFCDISFNLGDLCPNNQPVPYHVSAYGNFNGALEAKVQKSVERVGLDNTFFYNVSASEVKALEPILAQLSDLADTPQRANKAPKKDAGEKKGPKAAKNSKNLSEKVRVSKRITRTETYY
jgi:hypothetical protein